MTAELPEDRKKEILAAVPLGRYATPDEVAGVVRSSRATRARTSPEPSYPSTAD
jgi:hypothetical protein